MALESWDRVRTVYAPARDRFEQVAQSLDEAELAGPRLPQRQRLQAQLRECTQALIRSVRRLQMSYPEQFDPVSTEQLLEALQRLHDTTQTIAVRPLRVAGANSRRLFEADGLLLVGEPVPGEHDVMVLRQLNANPQRWIRQPDQRWVRADDVGAGHNPRADVEELARHAQARLQELPALRLRLQRYNRPHTLAADLEDLYIGESENLEFRLQQLREAGADHHSELMQRLQQEANALRAEGRQARIAHCKASAAPTGGILEYLIDANEVTLRKVNGLQLSGTTPRTRNWLQEYEVQDRADGSTLFYAHFHYRKADPRFGDFEVAHLKTPAQRYLTAAAPNEPAIWRGEISRRLAARLFEPLFA